MNVLVHHAATVRAIYEAVCRLPLDARRVAHDVVFLGVGVRAAGMALDPEAVGGRWVVAVAERDGAGDVVGHEMAHVFLGHRGRSKQSVRRPRCAPRGASRATPRTPT